MIEHVPANDHLLHFVLVGVGLTVGSLVKAGFDKFAEIFWDKEWQEFKKWKASGKKE
jgi:hypothetical protein